MTSTIEPVINRGDFIDTTHKLTIRHLRGCVRYLNNNLTFDDKEECGAVYIQDGEITAAFTFKIRGHRPRGLYIEEFCGDLREYGSEKFLQCLDVFAKGYDCSYIEFIGRIGWKRILKGRYKPIRMTYKREL